MVLGALKSAGGVVGGQEIAVIIRAIDDLTDPMDKAEKALKKFEKRTGTASKSTDKLSKSKKGLAGNTKFLTLGMFALGAAVVSVTGYFIKSALATEENQKAISKLKSEIKRLTQEDMTALSRQLNTNITAVTILTQKYNDWKENSGEVGKATDKVTSAAGWLGNAGFKLINMASEYIVKNNEVKEGLLTQEQATTNLTESMKKLSDSYATVSKGAEAYKGLITDIARVKSQMASTADATLAGEAANDASIKRLEKYIQLSKQRIAKAPSAYGVKEGQVINQELVAQIDPEAAKAIEEINRLKSQRVYDSQLELEYAQSVSEESKKQVDYNLALVTAQGERDARQAYGLQTTIQAREEVQKMLPMYSELNINSLVMAQALAQGAATLGDMEIRSGKASENMSNFLKDAGAASNLFGVSLFASRKTAKGGTRTSLISAGGGGVSTTPDVTAGIISTAMSSFTQLTDFTNKMIKQPATAQQQALINVNVEGSVIKQGDLMNDLSKFMQKELSTLIKY